MHYFIFREIGIDFFKVRAIRLINDITIIVLMTIKATVQSTISETNIVAFY